MPRPVKGRDEATCRLGAVTSNRHAAWLVTVFIASLCGCGGDDEAVSSKPGADSGTHLDSSSVGDIEATLDTSEPKDSSGLTDAAGIDTPIHPRVDATEPGDIASVPAVGPVGTSPDGV